MSPKKSESKPAGEAPEASDAVIPQAVEACMSVIDNLGLEHKLDGAKMVYLSLMVASQLIARNLFLASGPQARDAMKRQMEDTVSEILESAAQHMDRSEREMAAMVGRGTIQPH